MMKRLSLVLLLALVLPVFLFAQDPVSVDTTATMSDGISLDVLYVYPATPPPATGYPGILIVHGFGGSKNGERSGAIEYAKLGYVAVAYSVRGQGASEGEFDFFTSDRIVADLREMIGFTKTLHDVNDDRVGVLGGSQGGLHAWAASAYNLGARAVISAVANGRWEENWTENNALNYIFAFSITTTSINLKQEWKTTVQNAVQTGDLEPVKTVFHQYPTIDKEQSTTTPVLMLFSYYDQFFNPSACLRQFKNISAPKRAMVYPANHELSTNPQVYDDLMATAHAWFAYWLQDDQSYQWVLNANDAVTLYDGADNRRYTFALSDSLIWLGSETDMLPVWVSPIRMYIDNTGLSSSPPVVDYELPFSYTANLGGTAVIRRSAPLPDSLCLSGTMGGATIIADGSAARYQVNIDLFDYDPATGTSLPISRGHYQQNSNTQGEKETLTFKFNAMMHTVKAGHMIEARIHGGNPLLTYPNNNIVGGSGVTSRNVIYSTPSLPSYLDFYVFRNEIIGVEPAASASFISLNPNYPNPFGAGSENGSPLTYIAFTTASPAASLEVFNSMGQRVAVLHEAGSPAGSYTASFNAAGLPTGMYFAVLRDGNARASIPMMHIR